MVRSILRLRRSGWRCCRGVLALWMQRGRRLGRRPVFQAGDYT